MGHDELTNTNTADLIRLAEKISVQQIDDLFRTWIYTTGKPVVWAVQPVVDLAL